MAYPENRLPVLESLLSALNELPNNVNIAGDGLTDAKIAAITSPGTVAKLRTAILALPWPEHRKAARDFIISALDDGASPIIRFGAPTVTSSTGSTTGGSLATGTYQIKVTAFDRLGIESAPSIETTGNVASGSTGSIPVVIPAQRGVTKYRVYYSAVGGVAGSEQFYLESLKIYAALAAVPGARQSAGINLTVAQNNLATLYEMRGDYARADKWYQEALRLRRANRGERHPSVASVLNNLARMRLTQGQLAAAERLSREALSIRLEVLDSEHMHTAATRTVLGQILHARGALDAADEQFRAALVFQGPKPPAEHPTLVLLNLARGRLLIDRGHAAEAEPLLRTALNARARRFAASDWRVAEVQVALARALLAQGKSDAAAPLLASSATTLKQAGPGQQALKREADATIAQLQARPTPAVSDQAPMRASR